MSTTRTTSTGTTRRSLALGVAWSVPVLASAGLAPSLAASPKDPVYPLSVSSACKLTGGVKRYEFTLVFGNTLPVDSTLCITGGHMYANGCDADVDVSTASPGQCTTVPHGGTATIVVDSFGSSCLANGYMLLEYTYTDASGAKVTTTARTDFNDVPPCK